MSSILTASRIRTRFIEFFTSRGHSQVPSASLVPQNDPTLLFVNAGMNQFKDVFTGREQRPYTRAVSVQRCVRAGGKHNDLDNVGFTPRHQTMFEMLGNFSFGDYFKPEAIEWAWEFLTREVGLDPKRLVVTVFSGEGEQAPEDTEAYTLWQRFLPKERIYKCNATENFWQMGATGPCGPCSEIHIYNDGVAPGHAGQPGKGPAFEDTAYLELWNLVFMQYEKHEDGTLTALPKPCIDTGCGLERIAGVVAGCDSNYGTDLLAPLVELAKTLAGPGRPTHSEAPYRVLADHARATAFLIADGVFPEKKEREYVLRRIMRRAIRHATEVGLDRPFFHEMTAKVVEMFGEAYPELPRAAATISEVVQGEEAAFRRTLDRGLKLVRSAFADLKPGNAVDPALAADLYSTYGFPIDLTGVIAVEHGLTLDEAQAAVVLKAQAAGSNKTTLGSAKGIDDVYFAVQAEVGDSEFVGYEQTQCSAKVVALLVDGVATASVEAEAPDGLQVQVVLDRTPMYAESGGQVGDKGIVRVGTVEIAIDSTHQPVAGLSVHSGVLQVGAVAVGDAVQVEVDESHRDAIRRNHSATHLLHLALRAELGDHVVQKGSLVGPDRLRFDFSHRAPLSVEQRVRIEAHVNRLVIGNRASDTQSMSPDAARERGAIGLFGEKYGDEVRVVQIAGDSLELCGGTHVDRAGDIGLFAILSEGGIAQGVRRLEAVTGFGALAHVQSLVDMAQHVQGQLHVADLAQIPARVEKLQSELKLKERKIEQLNQKLATSGSAASGDGDGIAEVHGVKLLARKVGVADAKTLRAAADTLRDRLGSGVVVLGAENAGKATLLVAVTSDLKGRVHAGKLVSALAVHVEGRGGGKPELAQAGGPKIAGLEQALSAASGALSEMLA